jgi:hypothetical protein
MEEPMSHTPYIQCPVASKCKIQAGAKEDYLMPCCQEQSQAAIGKFKTQDFTTYLQLWHNHWYHYTMAQRNYSVFFGKKLLNFYRQKMHSINCVTTPSTLIQILFGYIHL